ncbi:MAG: PIG-L deacetylase family protein [Acidimicrobiales bacterium]
MATLVCFHAHPDDEAIATGGTMARAADEGHRVVLVVATDGAHGEKPDDLAPGETLVERRRAETERSAAVLGVSRVVWLGYRDSGMTGWEQNGDPSAFCQADVADASARLAAVVAEEAADVLTIYDWHGNYGHPDHIQVYRVGRAAEELLPGVRVVEATMNRDQIKRLMAAAREAGVPLGSPDAEDDEFDPDGPADDGNPMGMTEAELTLEVDVRAFIQRKRAAITCHRSQVTDTGFFLAMPPEQFELAFGAEWFIEHDAQPPLRQGWLF